MKTCNGLQRGRRVKRTPVARGFTLIEIILALALTAMLLGLLSSGVFVVTEDWNRNSGRLDASLDGALAVLQVERALVGAFPHSYTDVESLSRRIYFEGEDSRLGFVSSVSPQRSAGLMAWQLYNGEDGVYLKLAPAFSDDPVERLEAAEAVLILPDYTAEFRYLYAELDGSKEWRDDWQGDEFLSLPLAVYVNFTPLDGFDDQLEPLEIVARIQANQHRSIRPNVMQQTSL
ncbi:MAG: prepilin-type N-terminal cleavage/methylation domain-containing protein [Pseudohongiellaceae bacterium]